MMIGVLALQGGFAAHRAALERLSVSVREVRLPRDLTDLDGLIIPGGESTTMLKLLGNYNLFDPLAEFGNSGKPVLGTCAGAILMAQHVVNLPQKSFGWIPMSIERNAYGSQRESFFTTLDSPLWDLKAVPAYFIRAPRITQPSDETRPLFHYEDHLAGLVYRNFTVTTFHPELEMEDSRFHEAWLRHARILDKTV